MSDDAATRVDRALDMVRANPRDQAAWTAFYLSFRPQVAAALYQRGIRADLADLTQEVFFRFLRYSPWRDNWASLPDRRVLIAYLRRTAGNVITSRFREAERRPKEDPTDRLEDMQVFATSIGDVEGLLDRLIAQLDDKDGQLLRLLANGASLDQLASQYQITYHAAGVRVHRLKKKLELMLLDIG